MKRRSKLADEISSLVTAAPSNFNSDDESEDTRAKLVEPEDTEDGSENDDQLSKIRKQNVGFLDEIDKRYEGKKVSRKDAHSEDSSEDSGQDLQSPDSDDDGQESEELHGSENEDDGNEESEMDRSEDDDQSHDSNSEKVEEESGEEWSDNEPESEFDVSNPLRRKAKSELNFKHMTDTNVRGEVEKGNCVRNQLGIWENLLEMRIKLQKCLVASNKMPQYSVYREFKSDDNFLKNTSDAKNKLSALLNSMLKLQSSMLKNYPETKQLSMRGDKSGTKIKQDDDTKEDPMDEEIPSDTDEEIQKSASEEEESEAEEQVPKKKLKLAEFEKILSENHKSYSSYRNSVIQKWNDKTRVAVANVNKGSNQPVVKQIDFILNDRSKLLKRTQLKRSEYDILGKTVVNQESEDGRRVQEYDPEIYDDDDFYHQLLRELIEYKSADVTDPIQLSKQWIHLQNMRSKMKRKIDTKATKGRRIRYTVHSKLVNFMAPMTVNDLWTDEAKNELYSSLFGKIKGAEAK